MKIVTVKMDKERHLKFGVKAYVAIERALGVPMDKINFETQESIYALLLGGLAWEDKKLTMDKVMDIVENMIDKRAEEEGIPFMEAFGLVLGELGESIGEAMGNKKENPSE